MKSCLFKNPEENLSCSFEQFISVAPVKNCSNPEIKDFLKTLNKLWHRNDAHWKTLRNKVKLCFIRNYSYYSTITPLIGFAVQYYHLNQSTHDVAYANFHSTGTTFMLCKNKYGTVVLDKVYESPFCLDESLFFEKEIIIAKLNKELKFFRYSIVKVETKLFIDYVISARILSEFSDKMNDLFNSLRQYGLLFKIGIAYSANSLLGMRELNLSQNGNIFSSITKEDGKFNTNILKVFDKAKDRDIKTKKIIKSNFNITDEHDEVFSHSIFGDINSLTGIGLKTILSEVCDKGEPIIIIDYSIIDTFQENGIYPVITGEYFKLVNRIMKKEKEFASDLVGKVSVYYGIYERDPHTMEELWDKSYSELLSKLQELEDITVI